MRYVSSVYSVAIPLHVSGLLIAHHQKVTMYIRNQCFSRLSVGQASWKSTKTYNTYHLLHVYTLLPLDDGQPANPKHLRVSGLLVAHP
jgi:hypothetical protein